MKLGRAAAMRWMTGLGNNETSVLPLTELKPSFTVTVYCVFAASSEYGVSVTDRMSFERATAQAIVAKVLTDKPAPIITHRERVPPHVEDAVLTALEKLPADRFPSAEAFSQALGNTAFASTAPSSAAGGRAIACWARACSPPVPRR